MIESLVKKPRAFRHAQWRDDLLPSDDYQRIWQHVDAALNADKACLYVVRLLHLAKKSDRESALGRYVLAGIDRGKLPSLLECEDLFLGLNLALPAMVIHQHALADYQALLRTGGCHE